MRSRATVDVGRLKNPNCSMAISAKHRPKFEALHRHIVTSPYEWNILEWDFKQYTKKKNNKSPKSSYFESFWSPLNIALNWQTLENYWFVNKSVGKPFSANQTCCKWQKYMYDICVKSGLKFVSSDLSLSLSLSLSACVFFRCSVAIVFNNIEVLRLDLL